MVKKIYNVILDSVYPYIAGATPSSNQYYVNWAGIMPDKAYKVSFSFNSAYTTISQGIMCCLNVNLGCNDTFAYNNNLTTSNILGVIPQLYESNTVRRFVCDITSNPPIYISCRPTVNQITVLFQNGTDNNSVFNSPAMTNYILILSFEEMD
jgi:hypothetical protein